MRNKLLFFGLVAGLVLALAFTAVPDTSLAAPTGRTMAVRATGTTTGTTTDTEEVEWQPGFWDDVNIVIINVYELNLEVDLGEGYAFVFDTEDANKVEIKNGKVEIKGNDFKFEIKNGKIELKVGDSKIKVKAGHIPHGKAWGWWRKHGGYTVMGWTWIVGNQLVFQVPEGAEDDPELPSYEDFRKMVLANYMSTLEFAYEFDELKGGEFRTFDTGEEGVSEWGYWSADSGYILLGWIKTEADGTLVYGLADTIPISDEAFLEYIKSLINVEVNIEIKIK